MKLFFRKMFLIVLEQSLFKMSNILKVSMFWFQFQDFMIKHRMGTKIKISGNLQSIFCSILHHLTFGFNCVMTTLNFIWYVILHLAQVQKCPSATDKNSTKLYPTQKSFTVRNTSVLWTTYTILTRILPVPRISF